MKHAITYRLSEGPLVSVADKRIVTESYKHKQRIAPFHVLFYILEGQFPIIEDGEEHILNEGTLFFLKAGVEHRGVQYIPSGTTFIFMHFFLKDVSDEELGEEEIPQNEFMPYITFHKNRIKRKNFRETIVTLPKRIDNLQGSDLEHKILQLASFYNSGDAFRMLRINGMFSDILADCIQLQFKSDLTTTELRIQEIISYLQAHRDESFHSRDIEQHMGLSYKYMEESFKKRVGLTIQQYHTAIRIQEAERLLSATQDSISEISEKLGYQDPLYFSNVFKKATGVSPRNYRKNIETIIIE